MSRGIKLLTGVSLLLVVIFTVLVVLRLCGLLRPLSVPTGAMTPAVSSGDHVMMENMIYLSRQPRRGDIVVFKTDGIASLPLSTLYIKRVAGEPGDHVRISEGKLFVNDRQVTLSNKVGEITYNPPSPAGGFPLQTDVKVPNGLLFCARR